MIQLDCSGRYEEWIIYVFQNVVQNFPHVPGDSYLCKFCLFVNKMRLTVSAKRNYVIWNILDALLTF